MAKQGASINVIKKKEKICLGLNELALNRAGLKVSDQLVKWLYVLIQKSYK